MHLNNNNNANDNNDNRNDNIETPSCLLNFRISSLGVFIIELRDFGSMIFLGIKLIFVLLDLIL